MRKILINVSGAYLVIISMLLLGLFIMTFFMPMKASATQSVLQMRIEVLLFALWPLISGIGLFINKNWARISLMIMSAFALFMGIITILVSLLYHPARPYRPGSLTGIIIFDFIFFIAIPLIFIIFFNRRSVKELFIQEDQITKRPFGITFIAWYQLLGGFFSIFMIFSSNFKVPIGSMVLEGIALRLYWVVFTLLSLYIGFGLLKLSKRAWWVAIFILSFYLILGIVNISMLSESSLAIMKSQYKNITFSISLAQYRLWGALGMLIPTTILAYLISRKKYFISSSNV